MKKIIVLFILSNFLIQGLYAQRKEDKKIPDVVLSTFKIKFPNVDNVEWEKENENVYEAEFKLNGEDVSASFDISGTWLFTEIEIKITDLPSAIITIISQDFIGYKIEEACKVESARDGNYYEVEMEIGKGKELEVLFTADGKLLSQFSDQEKKDDKKEDKK